MKPSPKFFAVLTFALCFSFTGCGTISKVYNASTATVSAETSDQLIVSAEKATFIAADTFDTFLRLEFKHRAAYAKISPKIHDFAETLRADKDGNGEPFGIDVLKSARVATKTFKANRTPANEANLRTAWATLQKLIDDAKKYSALTLTAGQ